MAPHFASTPPTGSLIPRIHEQSQFIGRLCGPRVARIRSPGAISLPKYGSRFYARESKGEQHTHARAKRHKKITQKMGKAKSEKKKKRCLWEVGTVA